MIFVILGSQKFQFNRLLKEIDRLIEANEITEEVFAQIGYSDYQPQNYNYRAFLDRDEFSDIMSRCDKVITHGGTGAIVGAVKRYKRVIAVPRLAKYGEHVDDHQLQIVEQFVGLGLICGCVNISDLCHIYTLLPNHNFKKYTSNTTVILKSIEKFIENT